MYVHIHTTTQHDEQNKTSHTAMRMHDVIIRYIYIYMYVLQPSRVYALPVGIVIIIRQRGCVGHEFFLIVFYVFFVFILIILRIVHNSREGPFFIFALNLLYSVHFLLSLRVFVLRNLYWYLLPLRNSFSKQFVGFLPCLLELVGPLGICSILDIQRVYRGFTQEYARPPMPCQVIIIRFLSHLNVKQATRGMRAIYISIIVHKRPHDSSLKSLIVLNLES
mmetsp:Transcript_9091/g.16658  ORF Transcript_9091/g.16658 Transcript_9091/m.16658 type:complete len:221 (-) Transcript_9091:84-746(-)